jgi:hypothetical protein
MQAFRDGRIVSEYAALWIPDINDFGVAVTSDLVQFPTGFFDFARL